MKELLEAGVHFGHQTKRWNPKMKEYIFGERNGIYIIDLQKTLKMFKEASKFVQDLAAAGRVILFVGTKRQAQDAIAEEAQRCSMFYVNQRWLGGLLTNWVTVQKSVKRLKELDEMATDGRYDLLPKKEVIKLERERKHLTTNLAGIKSMKRLPDAIFVVDSNNEAIAVAEARDGVCTICHVRLRPQVFNTVRRNEEILQCDHCNRILYFVPAAAAGGAAARDLGRGRAATTVPEPVRALRKPSATNWS